MRPSTSEIRPSAAVTLLAVACLTIMVGCVIVPGLPSVARNLGVPDAASWLVTLPSLGVVLFGVPAGRLIDRAGAHRSLCVGLALYGALGVAGIALHGAVSVFANRLLLGGATALVMAAGTALISEFYEGDARLAMIARQGMAIELGGVVFLFVGGVLASQNWRWPFTLYLVAWVLLVLVGTIVPQPPRAAARDDDADATARPARLRDVYVAAAASMIVFFTGVILLPTRLHTLGLDEAETGAILSYVSLVAVVAAALMPRLVRRTSEGTTLVLAFLAYGFAHALFATSTTLTVVILGGAAMGFGFGFSIPTANHMVVSRSAPRQRGRDLARLSMAIFLGQFLSSFLAMIATTPASAFAIAAVGALIAAGVAALARRNRPDVSGLIENVRP